MQGNTIPFLEEENRVRIENCKNRGVFHRKTGVYPRIPGGFEGESAAQRGQRDQMRFGRGIQPQRKQIIAHAV